MNLDETLAEAMRRAADRVAVNPSPTAQTVERGLIARRRRRAATTATTVALTLAAIGVVAIPSRLAWRPDATGQQPQASVTRTTGTQPSRMPVRIVADGERISMPSGAVLWLNAQGLRMTLPGKPTDHPDSIPVPDGNSSRVTATAHSEGSVVLWTGIYHGPGTPAAITVDVDGQRLTAQLLALPGSPGWTAFAVEDPDPESPAAKPTVSAYAADGSELLSSRL